MRIALTCLVLVACSKKQPPPAAAGSGSGSVAAVAPAPADATPADAPPPPTDAAKPADAGKPDHSHDNDKMSDGNYKLLLEQYVKLAVEDERTRHPHLDEGKVASELRESAPIAFSSAIHTPADQVTEGQLDCALATSSLHDFYDCFEPTDGSDWMPIYEHYIDLVFAEQKARSRDDIAAQVHASPPIGDPSRSPTRLEMQCAAAATTAAALKDCF